ncbi:hypothetical protein ACH40D_45195 [Streptomyces olivaceoviridis]|uniref:Uncharacterized protein n=1 Tax=Streptomyces olivaceoviridis TaxID=1921 RepID=A0ABW7VMG1_STROI|nr:hypothetical protein [Streptomyces corchorusii]
MRVLLGAGDLVAEVEQPVAAPVGIAAESLEEVGAQFDREVFGEPQGVDRVGYRQHALWLSPAELEELISELRAAITPKLANQPSPERAQYLLSPIHFPLEARQAEPERPTTVTEQATDT